MSSGSEPEVMTNVMFVFLEAWPLPKHSHRHADMVFLRFATILKAWNARNTDLHRLRMTLLRLHARIHYYEWPHIRAL